MSFPSAADQLWLVYRARAIAGNLATRNTPGVVDEMIRVHERLGEAGLYAICCSLASVIRELAGTAEHERPGGWFGFSVWDGDSHEQLNPDDIGDPDLIQGFRFVVAHLNDDREQKLALFNAPRTNEQALQLPLGLVKVIYLFLPDEEKDAAT